MPDPKAVNSMFSRIAGRYDLANHALSGGLDLWWRKRLVWAVGRAKPADMLDLATGSGDVAFALARALPRGVAILGMDFCEPMLDQAKLKRQRAAGRYERVHFQVGDGMALPLPDASVDGVTIAFGLRNMSDRAVALREMRRVLRKGGRLWVLEFSQPHPWFKPFYLFYLRHILPRLAALITGDKGAYEYLNRTIESFPDRPRLAAEIGTAGFSSISVRALSFGIVALHEGIA